MANWLDKYEQGGLVLKQKTKDNYGKKPNPNDVKASTGPGFVGTGYDTTGRNYSPAWGGQFQGGGKIGAHKPTVKEISQMPDRPVRTDSNLENIIEIVDPYGISSWDDVYRSARDYGVFSKETAIDALGAIPMLGKFGKAGKYLGELSKAFAVTGRQQRNAKATAETLKAIGKYGPGAARATDAKQAYDERNNEYAMGGGIPGAVGFTYARVAGSAPANGKYAKKTKASAQDGIDITPKQFYNEYLNSPNYNDRLKLQGYENPKQTIKDRLKNLNETKISNIKGLGNNYNSKTHNINLDVEEQKENKLNPLDTKVHEYSHAAGSLGNYLLSGKDITNNTLNRNEINLIDRANKLWKIDPNKKYPFDKAVEMDHDRQSGEVKADMDTLRYKLRKDNIYNTGTEQFNQEFLDKSKEKYKSNKIIKRLFDRYKDKDLIKLMNTVAKNDDQQELTQAQNGTEMAFYQQGLDWKPNNISRDGSVIKDDRGQWAHPGEITQINSNDITMQGVDYPVLGVSDTGDTKMMQPGKDYKFKGSKVTEYPKGGWLDKYK